MTQNKAGTRASNSDEEVGGRPGLQCQLHPLLAVGPSACYYLILPGAGLA